MSKLPDPWPTLGKRLTREEDVTKRMQSSSSFFNSGLSIIDAEQIVQDGAVTIPNNGLLLVDGGDVVMLNEDLVEIFRIGVMEHGDRGLTIRRGDGTIALEMRKVFGPDDVAQALRILDREGRTIAGDAILSQGGFDAPFIPVPFAPKDWTSGARQQSTASATFVPLFEHSGVRQNPALRLTVSAWCSDGATSAEVQVYDPVGAVYLGGFLGSPAAQTITVPLATTVPTTFELGSAVMPGSAPSINNDLRLEVHARVTAGTGSVNVVVLRSMGRGV